MHPRLKIDHLAATLFGFGIRSRETLYKHGILRPRSVFGIKVISIGNLAMGGSGKTPLTMFLAERLAARGERVAVVLRGYGGRLSGPGGVASLGDGPLHAAAEIGDEAYLMARRLRGVSIRVGADREAQVRAARDAGATVAILDDGFQHRRLRRDLDILLAAPDHLASDARLFPEGVLRETPDSARRADIIGGFDADWRDVAGTRPNFTFSLFPTHLEARLDETHPIERLRDKRVFLLSAIARPERIERSVRELGACLAGHAAYRDHHRFTSRELKSVMKRALHKGASYIVTTEKDWVRGLGLWEKTEPQIVALVTRLDIASGENILMKMVTEMLRK